MSLKAYNGLMTQRDIKYIQEETIKRIPQFKEGSENMIFKTCSDLVVDFVDNCKKDSKFIDFLKPYFISDDLNIDLINLTYNKSIISILHEVAKIASKSEYVNGFTAHLNLRIEVKNDKILIYPNILVGEHRVILLEYLNDWYAQNQTDPPEDVSEEEWRERCDDWWGFSETRGYTHRIILFDPYNFSDSIIYNLNENELIDGILNNLPPDEKRVRRIALNNLMSTKNHEIKTSSDAMRWFQYYRTEDEGIKEVDNYIENNEIILTQIDKDFLTREIL